METSFCQFIVMGPYQHLWCFRNYKNTNNNSFLNRSQDASSMRLSNLKTVVTITHTPHHLQVHHRIQLMRFEREINPRPSANKAHQ